MDETVSTSSQDAYLPDDVIGHVPRYAIPIISSMLPTYTNSEQEFISRTFHKGNYDHIRTLPNSLKEQQVTAARIARQEAACRFLMPVLTNTLSTRSAADNQQGLFSTFEYQTSPFSLADEIAGQERLQSEAKQTEVSSAPFIPASGYGPAKNRDYDPRVPFPHNGCPETYDDLQVAQRSLQDARLPPPPFVPSGLLQQEDHHGKFKAHEMMTNLKKWILQDWEGADISLFENHQDCWVIRVDLATVDSQQGLVAYMNVFMRCNELVTEYHLSKVVEFWNTTPGDGGIYFVVRPPWVRPDRITTYFTLHPEERDWRTSFGVVATSRATSS